MGNPKEVESNFLETRKNVKVKIDLSDE